MSSPATIIPLFLLLLLLFSSATVTATPTVYQVLEEYDFPAGLLPTGVTSYTLNRVTGEFDVDLGDTCKFSVGGYDLKYKSRISGVISANKITKLKGVSIRVVLFWVDIADVTRYGNELDFLVGRISIGFDAGKFEDSPECGLDRREG